MNDFLVWMTEIFCFVGAIYCLWRQIRQDRQWRYKEEGQTIIKIGFDKFVWDRYLKSFIHYDEDKD